MEFGGYVPQKNASGDGEVIQPPIMAEKTKNAFPQCFALLHRQKPGSDIAPLEMVCMSICC